MNLLATGPTWRSAKSKGPPSRTLDRCITTQNSISDAEASLDWENAIADHAVLVTKISCLDIDRNIGRPRRQQPEMTWVDERWQQTKSKLKTANPKPAPATNVMTRFWEAKRRDEYDKREPLTIIDDEGETMDPDAAVNACSKYLKRIWGKAEECKILYEANTDISQPPTKNEVSEAIKQLKRDTAVGRDKISVNAVQNDDTAVNEYHEFLRVT